MIAHLLTTVCVLYDCILTRAYIVFFYFVVPYVGHSIQMCDIVKIRSTVNQVQDFGIQNQIKFSCQRWANFRKFG